MKPTEDEIRTWIYSLKTEETCPKCLSGKLYRYGKAYWCSTKECMHGLRESGKYRGAAIYISGSRKKNDTAEYDRLY